MLTSDPDRDALPAESLAPGGPRARTMTDTLESFDFKQHEQQAVTEYLKVRDSYRDLASAVSRIVKECLRHRNLKVHSVDARAKDPSSFGRKASIPSESDAGRPKYAEPLREITDLAGVRVIAYFPNELAEIDRMLACIIHERCDRPDALAECAR